MANKIWMSYIVLDLKGQIGYMNDQARDLLCLTQKEPVSLSFRKLLLRHAREPLYLRLTSLEQEVAVFTGDQCSFVATEVLQVFHIRMLAGEILVLRSQVPDEQDDEMLHTILAPKCSQPIRAATFFIDNLKLGTGNGANFISKEPARPNSSTLHCYRRMIAGLIPTLRPFNRVHQIHTWPMTPQFLVDWIIQHMGWINSSSVQPISSLPDISLLSGREFLPKDWCMLHLRFSTVPIHSIETITFSELLEYECLWLIPFHAEIEPSPLLASV